MHRLRRLRGLLGLSIATALAWIPLSAVIAALDSLRGVQVLGRSFSVSGIFANAPVFAAAASADAPIALKGS